MSYASAAVGIDLGMKHSCVGVWLQKYNRVEIISNDQGNYITPSYVSFTDSERLVGAAAFNRAGMNPTNTIYDVKRLIGRRFSDPSVQNDIRLWHFNVVSGSNDKPIIKVNYKGVEKRYHPEEISSMVLAKMKEIAETYLDCPVENAVITVPAYFNYSQRRSTRDAALIAGINVLRIIDEPIAAAVAYGLDKLTNKHYVLVFDFGQDTLDVSLLFIDNGAYEVKATAVDTHLGDEDINKNMMNFLMEEFKRKYGKDMSCDQKSLRRLRDVCERAYDRLLYERQTRIYVDCLYEQIDFSYCISEAQFDELNADLYKRCMDLIEECIKDAKIEKQSINKVVLVGGSTRIPKVQYLLQKYFHGKRIFRGINPDEVVAYGAAILAENFIKLGSRKVRDLKLILESEDEVEEKAVLQVDLSEAQELLERLTSERDDARKEVEERAALQFEFSKAQELIEQLTSERDDARIKVEDLTALQLKYLSEAQELTELLTSERDATRKEVEEKIAILLDLSQAQKLVEQLQSERDSARKEVEERAIVQFELSEAYKLVEKLTSERDDARKEVEERASLQVELSEAQKLIEQLISDARKEVEERASLHVELSGAQKHIEHLKFERDDARKEVEELRQLTKQQVPHRQCLRYCAEYSYSELQDATNNFQESFKLGEGGFGVVFMGILYNIAVAIKILKERSSEGAKEFHQEIEILSQVRHPNLVTLIGVCSENRALIYEYIPNGSLEDHLQRKNNIPPLSWQARVRIAFEICSALSFLHCSEPNGIVHGDLKPDNVLLDVNNRSKICDFGLCRQLDWTASASIPCHWTENPKGTLAYMDPEYLSTGKITPQYDVYSFGIMLLRLVTCKDPRGIRLLVEEAKKRGTLKTLVDASAGPWPFKEAKKMISLGLRCSDPIRKNRPDLSTKVLREMKSMLDIASASVSS